MKQCTSIRWKHTGFGILLEKILLSLLLPVCREFGEKRILLTCDKTNEASRKTIVANGGVLENEVPDDGGLSESGIIGIFIIGDNRNGNKYLAKPKRISKTKVYRIEIIRTQKRENLIGF